MTIWNPKQYLKFEHARTRPARDLAGQIELQAPMHIIDLGCGPGTSTQVLYAKWPKAHIEGIDSSTEMLGKAASDAPHIHWIRGDLNHWSPDKQYDLIFSNAALQWVDPVHDLLARCIGALKQGGQLAFQVPNNEESPYHLCILEVAGRPKWRRMMKQALLPLRYNSIAYYYDLLADSALEMNVWETRYYQFLDGAESILEWVSGTGLRPYLQSLPQASLQQEFKSELLELYQAAFPAARNGKVIFPFNRQFFIVTKK